MTARPDFLRLRKGAAATALAAAAVTAGIAAPAHAATAPAAATVTCPASDVCLLDARTGAHPDYDRLVFDLTGPASLTARTSPDGGTYGPSGEERFPDIKGSSYLIVTVDGAQSATYSTPRVDNVGLPSLKAFQLAWSAEGQTQFVLSLNSYSTYVTSHLTAPDRLIVDIYH